MRSIAGLAALVCAVSLGFADASAAGNWARDEVQRKEAKVFARAAGRAADLASHESTARMKAPGPSARIIGGTLSPPNRWPFQVGLLLASEPDNYLAQFCAGSIIDEEFILTTAHCAEVVNPAQLHILTGTQSLDGSGTRRSVKRIRIHQRYNSSTFDYDVALIQLTTRMPTLMPWQKARIVTPKQERRFADPRTNAMVLGWGNTGGSYPTALREVAIPIVPRDRCDSRRSYNGSITGRMICAGLRRGGKDSCQGDSGGPLLVLNRAGRYQMQVGIVSWGDGCARPNFYGVYTRLSVLEKWISKHVAAMRTP